MRNRICLVDPFLTSISYLSKEAERLQLETLHEILQDTAERISNYIIEELMPPEDAYSTERYKMDHQSVCQILMAISGLTPDQIMKLSESMDRELIEEKKYLKAIK